MSDNEKTSIVTSTGKSSMTIRDVSVEDEGMYRCVYDAGWQGEVSTQCKLYVFGKSGIYKYLPSNERVLKGKRSVLSLVQESADRVRSLPSLSLLSFYMHPG